MEMKRFLSVILAVAILFTLCMPVLADMPEPDGGTSITAQEADSEPTQLGEPSEGVEEGGSITQQSLYVMPLAETEEYEVSYSNDGSAWTESTFDTAWTAANQAGAATDIKLLKDITLSKEYKLNAAGACVNIYADAEAKINIGSTAFCLNAYSGEIVLGGKGGTLTIDGGGNANSFTSAAFQTDGYNTRMGTLTLEDGVVITNFYRTNTDTSYYGTFYNNGTLNINGGKITGNIVGSSNDTDAVIFSYKTLNIAGGEISDNSGGVVIMVDGKSAVLNMTGGKIINNNTGYKTYAIVIASGTQQGGSAIISGGTITGNKGMFQTVDMQAGKYLTTLTLKGNADIGSIGLDNGKYLTIEEGFNPPSNIELTVNGYGTAAVGYKFAELKDNLDVTGKFTYRNNSFTPLGNGTLGEYVTPEVRYQVSGSDTWIEASLADAVAAIGENTGKIDVQKDIELLDTIAVKGTITLFADSEVTLKRAAALTQKPMLEVVQGSALTLGEEPGMGGSITIDGGAVWTEDGYPNTSVSEPNNTGIKAAECVIYNQGTLNMYSNVVIQNNFGGNESTHRGAGIGNDGCFNMYGGKIWKNSCYADGETGGAVANNGQDRNITPKVTFNMYGGEICYNTAFVGGAVSVGSSNQQNNSAVFNMFGGKIYKNTCSEYALHSGGGVYVNKISTFHMTGGEITENHSKKSGYSTIGGIGGGVDAKGIVSVSANAVIRDNTAESGGADIWCDTPVNLTLPSAVTIAETDYTVTWYYDKVKDGDYVERYSDTYQVEKTDLKETTEQCGLKAVYTPAAEPEAEWKYWVYGTGDIIEKGTMAEAIEALKTKSNFEYVMLLKDVEISQSIPMSSACTLKSEEGQKYTITRADSFSGTMILNENYSPKLQSIILDGGNADNAEPLITGKGNTITLTDVILQNNRSNQNGSAICLAGAGTSLTATDLAVKNCETTGYGTIYFNKSGNAAKSISLTNAVFENNTALGGSAVYFTRTDSGLASATFSGCSFIGNKSASSGNLSTIDEALQSTNVIYVNDNGNEATVSFEGTTTFSQNTTNAELSIAAEHKASVWFQKEFVLTNADDNKLKVAVGSYVKNGTTGVTVLNAFNIDKDLFQLVGEKDFAGEQHDPAVTGAKLKEGTDGAWYVFLTPKPEVRFSIDGVSTSNDYRLDAVNTAAAAYGSLSVTPAMEESSAEQSYGGTRQFHVAEAGKPYTVTATPKAGYKVKANSFYAAYRGGYNEFASGTILSDGTATLTFQVPENFDAEIDFISVYVAFEKNTYKAEGKITPYGAGKVLLNGQASLPEAEPGERVVVMATPEGGYELDTIAANDPATQLVYDEASDTYSFTMPEKNVVISAAFKKVKYTITGEGDHVTFTIPQADTFDWGDEVTVTVAPEEWYQIKSVTAPGVAITDNGDGTYSFIMPQSNITVMAAAERPNFSVIFDSKDGTAVEAKVVANGDLLVKPAVPERVNYGFAGWYLDEEYTNKYDFATPVTQDVKLYARWFLWGDVNGDNTVDASDALIIQRCRIGALGYDAMKNYMAAFVNGIDKQKPDATDALVIQRYRLGYIERFPVETSTKGYEFDLENDRYYAPGL